MVQHIVNLVLKLIGAEIRIILNMGIDTGTVLYDMPYKHQAFQQVFLHCYLLVRMGIVVTA